MSLLKNLKQVFRPRAVREIELEYLNGATSPVDLELRMREVDRGRLRRFPRQG